MFVIYTKKESYQQLMKLRILYHGNCFDGVSSAAFFTKFYRTKFNENAEI